MLKNNFKLLIFIILIFRNLFIISSISWFRIWLWLEINLISFISINLNYKFYLSIESSLIYFIIQTIASTMIIFSILISILFNKFNSILFLSLLIKIRISPFHYWLLIIIESINWNNILILLTWQKLGPIVIFLNLNLSIKIFIPFFFYSITIGSIIGIKYISLKKIIAFSSINQLGWLILSLLIINKIWKIYFIIYFIIIFIIIKLFNIINLNYIYQIFNLKFKNKIFIVSFIIINLISLMGIPPLLGFLPKLLIIIKFNNNLILFFLIIFSLFSSFYYLRIFIPIILINSKKIFSWIKKIKFNNIIKYSIISNFFLIFLFFI